jgi:hypothetical protein
MKLSEDRFRQAVDFMKSRARPLEKALYACYFEGVAAAGVLDELAKFQNGDGGFGHGLEPDIRLDDSSVIATTIAFQRFRELKAPADHPMIAKACRYLLSTYDAQHLNWPIIPSNIDDAPHAPWWVHGGDLEKSMSNPRAEISGYLHDYPQHFPKEMREVVTESVVNYLLSQPDQMEMHDLLCYIRLWETQNPPEITKTMVLEKLSRIVDNAVERNPEEWKNYGLPPLAVIATPESPFAGAFADEIPRNLDFIIESQSEGGTWGPNWSWGDQWADVWEQAKRDWTGYLTLENLRKLRAFGRIE